MNSSHLATAAAACLCAAALLMPVHAAPVLHAPAGAGNAGHTRLAMAALDAGAQAGAIDSELAARYGDGFIDAAAPLAGRDAEASDFDKLPAGAVLSQRLNPQALQAEVPPPWAMARVAMTARVHAVPEPVSAALAFVALAALFGMAFVRRVP